MHLRKKKSFCTNTNEERVNNLTQLWITFWKTRSTDCQFVTPDDTLFLNWKKSINTYIFWVQFKIKIFLFREFLWLICQSFDRWPLNKFFFLFDFCVGQISVKMVFILICVIIVSIWYIFLIFINEMHLKRNFSPELSWMTGSFGSKLDFHLKWMWKWKALQMVLTVLSRERNWNTCWKIWIISRFFFFF